MSEDQINVKSYHTRSHQVRNVKPPATTQTRITIFAGFCTLANIMMKEAVIGSIWTEHQNRRMETHTCIHRDTTSKIPLKGNGASGVGSRAPKYCDHKCEQ